MSPKTNESFTLHIAVRMHPAIRFPVFNLDIRNHIGNVMTAVNTTEQGYELPSMEPGDYEVAITVGPISSLQGITASRSTSRIPAAISMSWPRTPFTSKSPRRRSMGRWNWIPAGAASPRRFAMR